MSANNNQPQSQHHWQFFGDIGWADYDSTTSTNIEQQFCLNVPSFTIVSRRQQYQIIFDPIGGKHTQTNCVYHTVRNIQRVVSTQQLPLPPLPPLPQLAQSPPAQNILDHVFGIAQQDQQQLPLNQHQHQLSFDLSLPQPNFANIFGLPMFASPANLLPQPTVTPVVDAIWSADTDRGQINFSPELTFKLETAYQAKESTIELAIHRFRYRIDFDFSITPPKLTQTNLSSFTVRAVHRASLVVEESENEQCDNDNREPEQWEKDCAALKSKLLSGSCMSSSGQAKDLNLNTEILSTTQIVALLKANVPNIDQMTFRTSTDSVVKYIISTYHEGLHMVRGNPALLNHSKNALQYIFTKVNSVSEHERKSHLKAICEAFMSCQAEQARVIDDIFGQISGRDKTLKDQVIALLDRFKQTTFDEVTLLFHPGSGSNTRLPHIQSRYRIDIGSDLGLPGIENAKLDVHAEKGLPQGQAQRFAKTFRDRFNVIGFVKAMVADVNQQDVDAERFILPDTLFKWAQPDNKLDNHNFDSHTVFYDETTPEIYNDSKPKGENQFKPFVHPKVVVDILSRLLLY